MELFGPNNHSKSEIIWRDVGFEKAEVLRKLLKENYSIPFVFSNIEQVDAWEKLSNNFRVRTCFDHGERVSYEHFLFKKHIQLQDEFLVNLSARILMYLRENGILVPSVFRTKTGQFYFSFDGYFFQLYEFIDGHYFQGTMGQLVKTAREIARIHVVFKKIPFADEIAQKPLDKQPWDLDTWFCMFEMASHVRTIWDYLILENEKFILGELSIVGENKEKIATARKQVVRNSLHPHDVLFAGDELRAIIDFEETGVNELVRDVGGACHRFARQYVVHQGKPWQEKLPEAVNVFLEEYLRVNALSKEEVQLMPLFIRDEILRKIFKFIKLFYFEESTQKIEGGELEKQLILLKEASIVGEIITKL